MNSGDSPWSIGRGPGLFSGDVRTPPAASGPHPTLTPSGLKLVLRGVLRLFRGRRVHFLLLGLDLLGTLRSDRGSTGS